MKQFISTILNHNPFSQKVEGHSSGKVYPGIIKNKGSIIGENQEVVTDSLTVTLEAAVWSNDPSIKRNQVLVIGGVSYKVTGGPIPVPGAPFLIKLPIE